MRGKDGREKLHTPQSLWIAAVKYFEWVPKTKSLEGRVSVALAWLHGKEQRMMNSASAAKSVM